MENKEIVKILTKTLNKMKKEINKRNIIYGHGVDLANYQNEYFECLMDLIIFIGGKDDENTDWIDYDDLSWWLFEDVKKEYHVDSKYIDVSKAKDFLNFCFKEKE